MLQDVEELSSTINRKNRSSPFTAVSSTVSGKYIDHSIPQIIYRAWHVIKTKTYIITPSVWFLFAHCLSDQLLIC